MAQTKTIHDKIDRNVRWQMGESLMKILFLCIVSKFKKEKGFPMFPTEKSMYWAYNKSLQIVRKSSIKLYN